jgi:hypothetical protein
MRAPVARCVLAAVALAGCGQHGAGQLAIPPGVARIDCLNPVSGYAWSLRLDSRSRRVDGSPAVFEAGSITWRDVSDSGGYSLDRATGMLTITRASSTGGYSAVDRCSAHSRP